MPDVMTNIRGWAGAQPDWQKEALRRLYHQRMLTREDEDALYALLKCKRGIVCENVPVCEPWTLEGASERSVESVVGLLAVHGVRHANALAPDQRLTFLPVGLTAIYGDNGSGKSGYARLFKRACRARDNGEPLLPNVNVKNPPGTRASATFFLTVDGAERDVEWAEGWAAIPELQALVVFDSRCALRYIQTTAASTFVPDGMDLLLELTRLCDRLRQRLKDDAQAVVVDRAAYATLATRPTQVGRALSALTAGTSPSTIETLATLDEKETAELVALSAAVQAVNPKEQARTLRLQADRLRLLAGRCRAQFDTLSDEAVVALRGLVEASLAAKKVAAAAAEGFRAKPGLLPGTGDEPWREMMLAARTFVTHAHPGKTLDSLADTDGCPLCQQPLDEGAARLAEFDAVVEDAAARAYAQKKSDALAAFQAFRTTSIDIAFDPALCEELRAIEPGLCEKVEGLNRTLLARHSAVVSACKGEGPWEAVSALPADVVAPLEREVEALLERSRAMEAMVDESRAELTRLRHAELSDRAALAQVKESVVSAIKGLHLRALLARCDFDVQTHAITQHAGFLNQQILTPRLVEVLNNEFEALGVSDLRVKPTSKNVKGTTLYGLELERQNACEPSKVLSEGEHRAIAIGAFLADLALSDSRAGIIFDDPVSSLDHERRALVARRLVREAKSRQVILLSHDLAFMRLLQKEAKTESVPIQLQTLERQGHTSGVVKDSLPMAGLSVRDRLAALHRTCDEIAALQKQQRDAEAKLVLRNAWVDMRLAWERGVEEVLFNGVVQRFDLGVATQKLESVEFDDEDIRSVFRGMERCNITPHDSADTMNAPLPPVAELRHEVETMKTWVAGLRERHKQASVRRDFK